MARGSRGRGVVGEGGEGEALLVPARAAKTWNWWFRPHPRDELRGFRSCLRWMCMDQSNRCRTLISWSLFFVLSLAVPIVSHFILSYNPHRRPYDLAVQLSLTSASALSFICLSAITRRYGLRRFLFLDKLRDESEHVCLGYTAHLDRSFRLLSCLVLPLFAAEMAYKIWWYCAGASRIPFLGNPVVSDAVACVLELASWIYRTGTFFLVCVLFRLICELEILRLQDFGTVFQEESEVGLVLVEHLRIRRQLRVISHRFRGFILLCLLLVTASQFAALLLTTRSYSDVNLFNTGELALCSIVLVTGLFMCLKSAAKITHKAQALTSHAAKWHVCATIDSFDADPETPCEVTLNPNCIFTVNDGEGETDEDDSTDDELEDTKMVQPQAHTISFQKRQALVTYLENNRAGITIFGFTLDRTWLHTIFCLETTLFLWLLGKTIGIS